MIEKRLGCFAVHHELNQKACRLKQQIIVLGLQQREEISLELIEDQPPFRVHQLFLLSGLGRLRLAPRCLALLNSG